MNSLEYLKIEKSAITKLANKSSSIRRKKMSMHLLLIHNTQALILISYCRTHYH